VSSPAGTAPTPAGGPTPGVGVAIAPSAPRTGTVLDRGVARHDAVRAQAWRSVGNARVVGEVDVGTVTTRGAVTIGGRLTADEVRARGALEVVGEVRVSGSLAVRGSFHAYAPVRGGDVTLDGTTHGEAGIQADRRLSGRGSLEAPTLLAGAIDFEGAVDVPNTIEAWRVALTLPGPSRLGTVRAHVAVLRGKLPNLVEKVLLRHAAVEVERVEADEVELEGVDVGFVRSGRLTLGRGTHVTTVEGTIVKRHPTAWVGPRSETPPPHGLRR